MAPRYQLSTTDLSRGRGLQVEPSVVSVGELQGLVMTKRWHVMANDGHERGKLDYGRL